MNQAFLQANRIHAQIGQFSYPHAGRIEQLQQRSRMPIGSDMSGVSISAVISSGVRISGSLRSILGASKISLGLCWQTFFTTGVGVSA